MAYYIGNPRCRCGRCRMSGLMGPVVLITLGCLFLLQEFHFGWNYSFGRTWPILLIVIGIVKVLQYTAPTEGHVPYRYQVTAVPPNGPVVTPPPAPQAGSLPGDQRLDRPGQEDGHV